MNFTTGVICMHIGTKFDHEIISDQYDIYLCSQLAIDLIADPNAVAYLHPYVCCGCHFGGHKVPMDK